MRRISSALVALACGIGTCVDVMAAQVEKLPASGKARFQVSYVQWAPAREITLGDAAGIGTFEMAGITRNTDGKPWFDRMTERCAGQYYWGDHNQAPGTGTCLYVDADGDQVMVNWTITSTLRRHQADRRRHRQVRRHHRPGDLQGHGPEVSGRRDGLVPHRRRARFPDQGADAVERQR